MPREIEQARLVRATFGDVAEGQTGDRTLATFLHGGNRDDELDDPTPPGGIGEFRFAGDGGMADALGAIAHGEGQRIGEFVRERIDRRAPLQRGTDERARRIARGDDRAMRTHDHHAVEIVRNHAAEHRAHHFALTRSLRMHAPAQTDIRDQRGGAKAQQRKLRGGGRGPDREIMLKPERRRFDHKAGDQTRGQRNRHGAAPTPGAGENDQQPDQTHEGPGGQVAKTAPLQQALGGERMDIGAGHQPEPGRQKGIAQFLRSGADDDRLAADPLRIHGAGDDIGGGHPVDLVDVDAEIQPEGLVARPAVAGDQRRGGRRRTPLDRHVGAIVPDLTVAVGGHVDIDRLARRREGLDRIIDDPAAAGAAGLLKRRQRHLALRPSQSRSELGVIARIGLGAEVDVEHDLGGAHFVQAVEHARMQGAGPRPEPHLLQAGGIDFHHRDMSRRRAVQQTEALVLEHAVDRV